MAQVICGETLSDSLRWISLGPFTLVNDAHSQREEFNHGQDASEWAHSSLVQSDLVMSRTFEMFPGGLGIGGRTAFRTTASRLSNISRHTERDFDL